ncbi:neprilysin-11-like protein, partial [Dinothrombium tinctorium]
MDIGWPILEENWNKDSYSWEKAIVKVAQMANRNVFVKFFVHENIITKIGHALYIDQPQLSISPDVLRDPVANERKLESLRTFIKKSAHLLESNLSDETLKNEVEEMIEFEAKLVKAIPQRQPQMNFDSILLKDLEERQKIKWNLIFKIAFGDANSKFNGSDPVFLRDNGYFDSLHDIIRSANKRVIANYIGWHLVQALSTYATKEFRDIVIEFQRIQVNLKNVSLYDECFDDILKVFNVVLGYSFLQDYDHRMTSETKNLIKLIKSSMSLAFQSNDWMDNESKISAQSRLNQMSAQIAKPVWVPNENDVDKFYSKLSEISPDNYCGNFIQSNEWKRNIMFSEFYDPDIRWKWDFIKPKATYNYNDNRLTFSPGILQPPFYFIDGLESTNFGVLGTIVAHEITHGFDDADKFLNSTFDTDTPGMEQTRKFFSSKENCFIKQYSNYKDPIKNISVNGDMTLKENIADNVGLNQAFMTYKLYKAMNEEKRVLTLPYQMQKFTDEQLFFISFGNHLCGKTRIHIPS